MRFAGGRPLWHLSVTLWSPTTKRPVPVLRWSPNQHRRAEAIRDDVMRGLGTNDDYIREDMSAILGTRAVSVHWRKPLRLDEVPRMTETPEVRSRPGRP